jgi:hypothetical protein
MPANRLSDRHLVDASAARSRPHEMIDWGVPRQVPGRLAGGDAPDRGACLEEAINTASYSDNRES